MSPSGRQVSTRDDVNRLCPQNMMNFTHSHECDGKCHGKMPENLKVSSFFYYPNSVFPHSHFQHMTPNSEKTVARQQVTTKSNYQDNFLPLIAAVLYSGCLQEQLVKTKSGKL